MCPAAADQILPPDEDERQAALQQFKILGTPGDPAFDEICFTLQEQLDVPIVLISLADRNRHWFKSCVGIGLSEVPRETSFCSYTITTDEPLIVPDATQDPRFADNPFVTQDPHVRFYAGVPLLMRPGLALGSLCAIDTKPRQIEERQITLLRRMSHIAMEQLRHHKVNVELAEELAIRRRRAERVKSQRAQLNRHRRFTEQSARIAGVGGWLYEVKRQNLVWSREVFRIIETDELKQPDLAQAIELISDARQRREAERLVRQAIETAHGFEAEFDITSARGNRRRISITCEAETIRGAVIRLAGTIRDITALHETQKEVKLLATIDSLTRLSNRTSFMAALDAAIKDARATGIRSALLLADLDHFKTVNDTLGHSAGDQILKEFAERMRANIRAEDMVARLGGDEFAVLLANVSSSEGAWRVAEEILKAGATPFTYGGQTVNLGVSIGIRLFASDAEREALLQEADMALYHAKAAGKNCCAEFEPFMRMRVEAQHRLLSDVRNGLLHGQFTLHYLPQFELRSHRLTGFEALLRWVHPKEGLLKPGRFAEALADAVLSRELSNFALERAIEQIADWCGAGRDVGFVAVNIAQSQIGQKGFADHVKNLLRKHHVEAHLLMVEVVEQSVLEDASSVAVAELQELRDAGVTISLDDFGTGYASLTHLRKFPIRQLKIDRTVTDSIDKDITSLSVTKSIIELARTLNMRTVAEGVERQAVADILAACGCDQAQGFLWSGALGAHEASKLFSTEWRFDRHGTQRRNLRG